MKRLSAILASVLCLSAASCTSVPVAELHTTHTRVTSTAAPDAGIVLDVEGVAIDRLPPGWAAPLASRSTLITGPENELKAASPSAAELVIVEKDRALPVPGYSQDFGRVEALRPSRVLVPGGCAAIVAVVAPGITTRPAALEVVVQAAPDRPELRLRAARSATAEEAIMRRAGSQEFQTLRVPWPLESREGAFVLFVAASGVVERPTLWRLVVRAPTEPEIDEARSLAASLAPPAPTNAHSAALAASLRGTKSPAESRSALTFAALDAEAPVTAETAVLADDKTLLLLAAAAAASLDAPGFDDAGWRIDRATLAALAKLSAENALDRPLGAVVSARYGEVGRDLPALARFAAASATRADLDRRLEAEHLICLDDSSPSARVRAFDWLAARNAAPAGYDPLGPAKQRRAAVEKHVQSLEAKP